MRQWTGSALVQVMACRLFGTKLLPEPMLAYCQFDFWEQISVKMESEFYHFHCRKCIWNCPLPNWQPFCPGKDELNAVNDTKLLMSQDVLEVKVKVFNASSDDTQSHFACPHNRPISQIPQCIWQISHNAPFWNRNVHTCAHFCYKMVHCGIWDWCIMGFAQQVYFPKIKWHDDISVC